MISEGSCDTEDWSNDAENTALITGINYIIQYVKIEEKKGCIFNQINEQKRLLLKTLKIVPIQNF